MIDSTEQRERDERAAAAKQAYWESFQKCPVCGEKRTSSCRCMRADSRCPNNHEWHNCTVHNVVVIGPSDHSGDTYRCTCSRAERPPREQKKWQRVTVDQGHED